MTHGHHNNAVADVLIGAAIGAAAASALRPRRQEPPVLIVHQQPSQPCTANGVSYTQSAYPGTTSSIPTQPPVVSGPSVVVLHPPVRRRRRGGCRHGEMVVVARQPQHVYPPPPWQMSDQCSACRLPFTLFDRRHHCRSCGRSVCGRHSSHQLPLPHLGLRFMVRVCDSCHASLMDHYRRGTLPPPPSTTTAAPPQHHQYAPPPPPAPPQPPQWAVMPPPPAPMVPTAVPEALPVATTQQPVTAFHPDTTTSTVGSSSTYSLSSNPFAQPTSYSSVPTQQQQQQPQPVPTDYYDYYRPLQTAPHASDASTTAAGGGGGVAQQQQQLASLYSVPATAPGSSNNSSF